MEEKTVLILGAGWTATFLIPLLQSRNISFAATTTNGRTVAGTPTIPFKFNPSAPEDETRSAIAALPRARYVLITFPLTGTGQSKLLVECYEETHRRAASTAGGGTTSPAARARSRFIQLGSTGIWQQPRQRQRLQYGGDSGKSPWMTRHSPYTTTDPRAIAEDELLSLGGCVLDLAGLWGGARDPRHWIGRVGPTKEALREKKSLHMVHGLDVARGIVAVVTGGDEKWERHGRGQRWMVTDGFVYDWWALMAGWAEGEGLGEPIDQARWVFELMNEEGVKALPRSMEALGRCYDSREFWEAFGLVPLKGRV
ncbi:hypothetical protein C8A03DRAFT_37394 [Achaetomium macrosporum]|uniref:Uncharacterized protein n=1 Tax=Achaetomium macrosporum TaxID=79813 RepID=A0AAN7C4V3_9PEZI|nr:hypothetical protein C8A03DRAFT_37394 [Achaetomium macrosporum]